MAISRPFHVSFTVCHAVTPFSFISDDLHGQIRLVDGSFQSQGRVEVYWNGEWGTVCNNSFDTNDAMTVCQQLGYNAYDTYGLQGFP